MFSGDEVIETAKQGDGWMGRWSDGGQDSGARFAGGGRRSRTLC